MGGVDDYQATEGEVRELEQLRARLADAEAAISRHHARQLSGFDTNPAADLGGIRSRSQKAKDRIFDRFSRESKRAIRLYRERDAIAARIAWISSGRRAAFEREQQARAAARPPKRPRPATPRPRPAKSSMSVESLAAYNARAEAIHARCEAERKAVAPLRSRDFCDLVSARASGVVNAWTLVEATIVAAHMGRPPRPATVADLVAAHAPAPAAAVEGPARQAADDTTREAVRAAITARLMSEVATIDQIRAELARGGLAL